MIFAMDELGFENNEKILTLEKPQRWDFIIETARGYGFDGIHITPSLYRSFGLDVKDIPGDFEQFHLTYHVGGHHRVLREEECAQYEKMLEEVFDVALRHGMRDISLHPPVIEGYTDSERGRARDNLSAIMNRWTDSAQKLPFTLSLETHLYEPYFLFGSYDQYKAFSDAHPDMGILIDVSHNFFSGYSEQEIIDTFRGSNVTALHISDAKHLDDEDLELGTHLAIGDGEVDFAKIVTHFAQRPSLFAALEIKADNKKLEESVRRLRQYIS